MSDLFDAKAADWDQQSIPQQLSKTIGPAIIRKISLTSDMEVMDFGAGTGLLTAHIAPLVNKIAAVDISRAMLDKLANKPEFKQKVEIHCQNIMDQPLDTQYDLIISAMAMHHVEDTASLLHSFFLHLKPGASIALADLDKEDGSFHPDDTQGVYHLGFDREALRSLLEDAGFTDIRFSTAHTLSKDDAEFSVFLLTASKQ